MASLMETFLNSISDSSWSWGPFIRWRPLKEEKMIGRCLAKICLTAAAISALTLTGLYTLVWVAFPQVFGYRSPGESLLSSSLIGYFVVWEIRNFSWLWIISVPIMYLQAWPFAVAWNRRARRLQDEQTMLRSTQATPANSWPPPPRVKDPLDKGKSQ